MQSIAFPEVTSTTNVFPEYLGSFNKYSMIILLLPPTLAPY